MYDGGHFPLKEHELKAAFNRAKEEGYDYLAVYTVTGDAAVRRGAISIDGEGTAEDTLGIKKDKLIEGLGSLYLCTGGFPECSDIYPLDKSFKNACLSKKTIRIFDVDDIRQARVQAQETEKENQRIHEQVIWDMAPWYKKIGMMFGL